MQPIKIYHKEILQTIRLAVPVIIGQLGHIMMGVVDSVMIGKIGPAPLAAASVSNGLFFLILVMGFGISMAMAPLVAMAHGGQKHDECGVVLRQGLLVNLGSGIVLMIATLLLADMIRFFNQPPEIVEQAIAYTKTLGWSVIPVMIFQTYRQYTEGLSFMKPPMVITLLANIINVIANWIFIFGNLGAPALGLVGAGYATFFSRSFMALALFLYVRYARQYKPFDPTLHYRTIDWTMIRRILRIGLPGGFQYFFEVGAFAGAAVIIGWLGTNDLAAHQIGLNLASVSYMFALGFSAAASVRVGNAVGKQDIQATRVAGFSAIMLSATVMGLFGISFVILRNYLPTLYIENPEVISKASTLLIIAAIFQMFDGTQAVGIGISRGIADMRIPTAITFVAYWVVGLPGGYLLGFTFDYGLNGIWVALAASLIVSAVLLTLRFNQRSKSKIKV